MLFYFCMSKFLMNIRQNKEVAAYIVCFFVFPVIIFWRNFDITALNKAFFSGDFSAYYYSDFYLGTSLLGNIKELFWDPYNNLGLPLLGATNKINLFYPIKALFYFVGFLLTNNLRVYIFEYYSLFHMTLGSIFMFILARKGFNMSKFSSFIAGLIFGLSGTFLHYSVTPNHLAGMAFLPLTVFLFMKSVQNSNPKLAILAGFSGSSALLSGYIPLFIYNNLFLLLFALLILAKTKSQFFLTIKMLILSNLVAVGLSAVELLPNLELFQNSVNGKLTVLDAQAYPFPVYGILYYFFPYFFNMTYNYVQGYVGVLPFLLILFAFGKRHESLIWKLVALAVVFGILSMGKITELHSFVYNLVPFYSSSHRPAIMHYIVALCLGLLAGYGLDTLQTKDASAGKFKILYFGFIGLFSIFMGLNMGKLAFQSSAFDFALNSVVTTSIFYVVGVLAIHYYYFHSRSTQIKALLVLILLLDIGTLVAHNSRVNSSIDPRQYFNDNKLISWLRNKTDLDKSRTLLQDTNVRHNSAPSRIFQVHGYYSFQPKSYFDLFKSTGDATSITPDSKALDLLGVKYFVSSKEFPAKENAVRIAYTYEIEKEDVGMFMWDNPLETGTKIYVYENLNANPRAYFVNKTLVAKDLSANSRILSSIDARNTAVINTDSSDESLKLDLVSNVADAKVVNYQNHKVEISANTQKRGFLVLADMYFPGWEAYVDGVRTPIYKANLTLRGIFVPPGHHNIVFEYRPLLLYIGAFISLGFLVVSGLFLLRKTRA